MSRIVKWGLGATALALTLAISSCDNNGAIKFPGFSKPDEPAQSPPPPPVEEADDQADTGPEPADNAEDTGPVPEMPADDPGSADTPPNAPDTTDTSGTDPADPGTAPSEDTAPGTEPPEPPATDEPHPHPEDPPSDAGPADPEVPVSGTDPEPPASAEPVFTYNAPGVLLAGSGNGARDETIYAPDLTFPIKDAPAYLQSQVWGYGGGMGTGGECDERNYRYPWYDNFCETRTSNYNTAFCPTPKVHLGQDIRVGTRQGCEQMRAARRVDPAGVRVYEVVAAEDGIISNIGRYTVNVRAGSRIYRYLHMNMGALQVALGDTVTAGQTISYISKDFGGSATTFHLHFEIKQNTADYGWAYVPPYMSLVQAYERREGGPGERIEMSNVGIAASPRPIPEGMIITE